MERYKNPAFSENVKYPEPERCETQPYDAQVAQVDVPSMLDRIESLEVNVRNQQEELYKMASELNDRIVALENLVGIHRVATTRR